MENIVENRISKNGLYLFLGITLLVQAVTSLIGGILFKNLGSETAIASLMVNVAQHVMTVNISILLQFITAIVIIMLGVSIYQSAGYIHKTMAILGLLFYAFEATLLAVSQVFTWGLLKTSLLYTSTLDPSLLNLGAILFDCKDFAAKMAIIPFGLGALLLYYLLLKSKIIPKWLALWGLVTSPLILVCIPLMAFGIKAPLFLLAPYVPFEFFAGIYIIIRYRDTHIDISTN